MDKIRAGFLPLFFLMTQLTGEPFFGNHTVHIYLMDLYFFFCYKKDLKLLYMSEI